MTAVPSINLTTEPLIGGSIAIIRSVIFRSIRLTSLLCTIDDTTILMIPPFDCCCSYNLLSHINFAPSFETNMAHSDPSSSTIIPSSIVEPCCWTYLSLVLKVSMHMSYCAICMNAQSSLCYIMSTCSSLF